MSYFDTKLFGIISAYRDWRCCSRWEKVRISSARGTVDAVAMVTVRLTPFKCGGKTVHQVGMTFNYGWLQPKECGDTANLLSPMVGDANSMTPEYKAFMVNIDKIKA